MNKIKVLRPNVALGTPWATSVSLYYGVSGENRVVTIDNVVSRNNTRLKYLTTQL